MACLRRIWPASIPSGWPAIRVDDSPSVRSWDGRGNELYGAGKHRSRALRLQEIEGEPIQSPAALHQSPT
jgi:hypothetical protein